MIARSTAGRKTAVVSETIVQAHLPTQSIGYQVIDP